LQLDGLICSSYSSAGFAQVPEYFRDDLFALLGDARPDHRWVIIGPAGSGSSFHVDPNRCRRRFGPPPQVGRPTKTQV
jgi:hypothetical protein